MHTHSTRSIFAMISVCVCAVFVGGHHLGCVLADGLCVCVWKNNGKAQNQPDFFARRQRTTFCFRLGSCAFCLCAFFQPCRRSVGSIFCPLSRSLYCLSAVALPFQCDGLREYFGVHVCVWVCARVHRVYRYHRRWLLVILASYSHQESFSLNLKTTLVSSIYNFITLSLALNMSECRNC